MFLGWDLLDGQVAKLRRTVMLGRIVLRTIPSVCDVLSIDLVHHGLCVSGKVGTHGRLP